MAEPEIWRWPAAVSVAQFAYAVAALGDTNGDGYGDLLVGQNGIANMYLFLGSASGPPATPTTTIAGPFAGGFYGLTLSGGGDVNGDGLADAVVSAAADPSSGRVYVYLGAAGTGLPASPNATLINPQGAGRFGSYAAQVGDLNGDGYTDVCIGTFANIPGYANIYYGGATGLLSTPSLILTAPPDGTGDGFASSIGMRGDVNADGFDDLLLGNFLYPNSSDRQGRAYVYYGSAAGVATAASVSLPNVDGANASYGGSVGSADVDGDGIADLVMGSSLNDRTGRLHIFRGGPLGLRTPRAWVATGPDGPYSYFPGLPSP